MVSVAAEDFGDVPKLAVVNVGSASRPGAGRG